MDGSTVNPMRLSSLLIFFPTILLIPKIHVIILRSKMLNDLTFSIPKGSFSGRLKLK